MKSHYHFLKHVIVKSQINSISRLAGSGSTWFIDKSPAVTLRVKSFAVASGTETHIFFEYNKSDSSYDSDDADVLSILRQTSHFKLAWINAAMYRLINITDGISLLYPGIILLLNLCTLIYQHT